MKREIIEINEEKCNGCEECIPACPEGALQIIDGKARLVNESFCDGLGACIGHCPQDAITIEERETEPYDETAVVDRMLDQGEKVLKAHLKHLEKHRQDELLQEALDYLKKKEKTIPLEDHKSKTTEHTTHTSCPSSVARDWKTQTTKPNDAKEIHSSLKHWPVQLKLVVPNAPYFENADLLISADCVPFAYANFHNDLLDGKSLVMGCPKLDDSKLYVEKLTQLFQQSDVKSVTIAHMEVPCCFGIDQIVKDALKASGKSLPVEEITINVKGEKL
ncbi:4Fe-4S ferredoxin [candidate division MSBL1 archaeon SCGC-AAA382F02]|uniref:4Fe-4S ferredoxin n=1 Tax=candidate division MSBL1 archaeon SCGC-AAA382F02 TaxID=1698282 RepID=A0A133VIZ8_9EURY|nr:4Fe-4S ferredoxin [candidate division MSBL1 archaeon SCGC-AAA382F02]